MNFTESVSLESQRSSIPNQENLLTFPHPFSPEIQFVSHCLRQLFWLQKFDNLKDLEKAIIQEDVYGIFKSSKEKAHEALLPFVTSLSHSKADQEAREREGVEVYFIPILEAVSDGYRKTKRTAVAINLLSTWREAE